MTECSLHCKIFIFVPALRIMKNFVKELEWRGLIHDIMPGTDEQAEPQEERAQTLVVVQVKEDSSYNLGRMEASDELLSLPNIAVLEEQLISMRDEERDAGNDIVVVIEADNLSQIQWTIDVLDLCDQYNIPKNINSGSLRL